MKHKFDSIFVVLMMVTLGIGAVIVLQWQSIRMYLFVPPSTATNREVQLSSTERLKEIKIQKLEQFLRQYKSPLYSHAKIIVEEAEKNSIDYRLIPAIAMNESTLCQKVIANSYNCWGWGIYGNTVTRFDSYEDAIQTISRGLRRYYYDKGMTSPSAIMKAYTPNSPDGIWAKKIEWAYRQIDRQ